MNCEKAQHVVQATTAALLESVPGSHAVFVWIGGTTETSICGVIGASNHPSKEGVELLAALPKILAAEVIPTLAQRLGTDLKTEGKSVEQHIRYLRTILVGACPPDWRAVLCVAPAGPNG